MNRFIKQTIYGALYLAVVGAIGLAIFGQRNATPPDCAPNCPPAPPTVQQVGSPQIFKTSDNAYLVALAAVKNPSVDYGASELDYTFELLDGGGQKVAVLPGTDELWPGEERFLTAVYSGPNAIVSRAVGAALTVAPPVWRAAAAFASSDLAVVSGPATTAASSGINVLGTVANRSGGTTAALKIVALIDDKYQDVLFAGSTTVPPIAAYGSAPFTVNLPGDPAIAGRLDPKFTQVYLYQ